MRIKFLFFSFFIFFSCTAVAVTKNAEQPVYSTPEPIHLDPIKILAIFYRAVNRGELIVFDQKIEKILLIPIQVEYVYKFDGSKPFFKIYSELKYPITVPGNRGIQLRGVTAVLNNTGHIIEVRAHVRPSK